MMRFGLRRASKNTSTRLVVIAGLGVLLCTPPSFGQEPSPELRDEVRQLRELIIRQSAELSAMRQELEQVKTTSSPSGPARLNGTVVPASSADATEPQEDPLDRKINDAIAKYDKENSSRMLPKGVATGYDSGFYIASPEGIKVGDLDVPFLLRHRARLQFRHSYFDSTGPNPDENDFELERARLQFLGYFLRPYLEYQITLDGDEDDTREVETIGFYDWFISYNFSKPLGWECSEMGLRFGKWKSPMWRQETESSGRQQFTDRSMADKFFQVDRNDGVTLFGKFDLAGRPLKWEAGFINGFNTTTSRPSRAATTTGAPPDMDNDLAFVSKTSWDLIGEWGDADGEPDIMYHCCPALRAGTTFGATRVDLGSGTLETRESREIRVCDTGARLTDVLPDSVSEFTELLYGADWGFKYRGWSLNNEYFCRNIFDFAGADVDNLFDWGTYAQLGYFIVPKKVEVAGRYSTVIGNSSTLGGNFHSGDEVAGTFNYYVRGHNLKFQFDVSHYNGAVIGSSSGQFLAGDEGWLFRTQVQIYY